MRHIHTAKTSKSFASDDLSSCMASGHSRKHRHGVRNPGSESQDWKRAESMNDTCAKRGSRRASGAKSADWGHAR